MIFDCDGVLADSESAWAAAERELCLTYGVDRDQSPRVSTIGRSSRDSVLLLMPGLPDGEIERAERMLEEIALRIVPARVQPMPGAVDLVSQLADVVPIGVASNTPRAILGPVLSAIGVAPFVTVFMGADDVEYPKPAPHIYVRTCELLGFAGREVLVLEDSLTGIASAREAGCRVIHVGSDDDDRASDVDGFIPSLDGSLPLLAHWLPIR